MKKNTIILLLVLLVSFYIGGNWSKIKGPVSAVLDPTFGYFFNINIYFGLLIFVAFTSLLLTLAQKYLTDQETLKELKKEQKILQEEMKKFKEHPEKLLELQKKQFSFIPKTMELTMRPLVYTMIPLIIFFRWLGELLHPIFGGWWLLYYIIGSMIFSSIFKKFFDVV